MDTIYRFLRPTRFNPRGNMIETDPLGGVCLKITRDAEGGDFLQVSVCPEDRHFSKNAAKHQAGLNPSVAISPTGYAFAELMEWVDDPDTLMGMEKILHTNELVATQKQVYKTALSALRLQARYNELQHGK